MSNRTYYATRIHFVGDSFTVGMYATAGNSYREKLLATLQSINPLYGSERWSNIAADGARVSQQVTQLPGVFRPDYDAHVIIFALGQNDSNTPPRTPEQFRQDVQACFDYVKNNTRSHMIVLAIPFQPAWTGSSRAAVCDGYNQILMEEALLRNFGYAPSWRSALLASGVSQSGDVNAANASNADGYHPNNTGHTQLYNALWRDISGVLTRAMRRPVTRSVASGRSSATGRGTA